MRSDRAPVVATWLVDRFCGEPAVAGDLIEVYRDRPSTLWFWKQALVAVFACSGSRVWEHKWLTLRAIATGWVFASIVIRIGMREIVHPWWDAVAFPALYPVVALVPWLVNGWLIGRLHRPYSTAMVLAYSVWLAIRSAPPVYDAIAAGNLDAVVFELWSRGSSVLVMICGGVLSSASLRVPRRSVDRVRKSLRSPAASGSF